MSPNTDPDETFRRGPDSATDAGSDDAPDTGPDTGPDTESRLRAALQARAERVTRDQLTGSFAAVRATETHRQEGTRIRSWLLPVAASLLIAVAAVGIGRIGQRSGEPVSEPATTVTVTPVPNATTSPATAAQPLPLATSPSVSVGPPATASSAAPAGEYPKSAVPWSAVGAGWVVAEWATSPDVQHQDHGTATLYLVSPAGARYPMASLPVSANVLDVTHDGRRILVSSSDERTVIEWDLAAGTSRTIPVGLHTGVHYTNPGGQALLVDSFAENGTAQDSTSTQRRALDGSVQLAVPGVDTTQSPDGAVLVSGGNSGLVVRGNASGGVIRTLPNPAGYASCFPRGWWPDGRVVAMCGIGDPSTRYDVFLYSVAGGSPSRVTSATAASTSSGMGFQDAWPLSNGTLVQDMVGCGTGPVGRLVSPSQEAPVKLNLPASFSAHVDPHIGFVVGDVGYFSVTVDECAGDQASSLVAADFVSGQTTVLLGPGANGGTVGYFGVIDPLR